MIKYKLTGKGDIGVIQADIKYCRDYKQYHYTIKTQYCVSRSVWDEKKQRVIVSKKRVVPQQEKEEITKATELNRALAELQGKIEECVVLGKGKAEIEKVVRGSEEQGQIYNDSFVDGYREYVESKGVSDARKKTCRVFIAMIERYEQYNNVSVKHSSINTDLMSSIISFFRNEYKYIDTHEYRKRVENPVVIEKERSENYTINLMKALKNYIAYCVRCGKMGRNVFDNMEIGVQHYSDPFYLSVEELEQIATAKVSNEIQRDVFVFHCCIGCRVSDLISLTWDNVRVGDNDRMYIEYVPHKTKDKANRVVKVPLNERATAILNKYCKGERKGKLLPFITDQAYNRAIKKMAKESNINRLVLIRDAETGENVNKPLYDVISSHSARKTFCGNLYNKGVDTMVIEQMSGHTEGSKAFKRYAKPVSSQLENAVSLL